MSPLVTSHESEGRFVPIGECAPNPKRSGAALERNSLADADQ